MRVIDPWTAFLLMLFFIVGLCGMFTSYAASIPQERAAAREALLDTALIEAAEPGSHEMLEQLRPRLDSLAPLVLDSTDPMAVRVASARRVVADEQRRETASITYRTRLMLGVVTVIAAGLGAGMMAMVRRQAGQARPETLAAQNATEAA